MVKFVGYVALAGLIVLASGKPQVRRAIVSFLKNDSPKS